MRKEWIKYTEETTRWSKNETDPQIFSFFFPFFPLPFACLVFFLFFLKFRSSFFFTREKMEIEDEHEELKAVRRNCEKLVLLVSSSSSSSDEDEGTTTISNCLRSLRALFSRKKEVSPKECLRVRSFLF